MKVLLLKDAKEDDSGLDPYIQVSGRALFRDPLLLKAGMGMLTLGELGA
jgi:hypothetical protein